MLCKGVIKMRINLRDKQVLLVFAVPVVLFGIGCFGEQEARQFSWSVAEAKKKGTFVCEVEIVPDALSFTGKKITFEAAWLERQPDGDYALCFRIDQGIEVFKGSSAPFFVRDERRGSFQERHGRDWLQFVERLDSDDLSQVRASLIQSWKDERTKDIHFVRKDKKDK
jgi:hypothetical protein